MLNTHTLVKDLVSAGLAEKVAIILGDAISASTKEHAEKIEKEQIGIKTDLIILKETAAKKVDVVKLESDLVTKDFFEQKIDALDDKFKRKFDVIAAEHKSILQWIVSLFMITLMFMIWLHYD